MQTFNTLCVSVVLAAMLACLGGCNLLPAKSRPDRGQTPAPEATAADQSAAGKSGGAADSSDSGQAAQEDTETDAGSADESDTASDDAAEPDSSEQDDAADDAADGKEDDASAAPAQPDDKPAPGLDLSGNWLQLFSRDRNGVQAEQWKSGKTYHISGDRQNLSISATDGSFDASAAGNLKNVSLSRSGPYLIVEHVSIGRSAYLRLGSSGELGASGELSGQLAGQKVSGRFTNSASGLELDLGTGVKFSGKAREGSFIGFLEGSKRGYCVLTITGNGILEGILFEDPYMSFATDLHLEVMP
jgi:hypothetical protein